MIKTKTVNVKMIGNHIGRYRRLGYDCKVNEIVEVRIEDLAKGSHSLVSVTCDYCFIEKSLKYYIYNKCIEFDGNYYCSNCSYEKVKKLNLSKYGTEHTLSLEDVKLKRILTLESKYGIDNISKISQTKVKNTKQNKYGSSSYNNRNKAKETMISKYGVENSQHISHLFNKQQISGYKLKKYNNLLYRGSYELDFIIFCEKNNILLENGPSIRYHYQEKNKTYHSDFYLPDYNLICEIKSKYYYEKYIDLNLIKMKICLDKGYNFTFIIDKNYEYIYKIKKGLNN
jgi:hypothetical protein